MFEPEEPDLSPLIDEADIMAYLGFPNLPPRPPPRPHASIGSSGGGNGEGQEEEEQKPVYRIIPFWKKSEVTLNFPRKSLEEFMDRSAPPFLSDSPPILVGRF